ncbi:hypothetical protein G5G08_000627 [Salmonella enterica subsp. enterica]|nr:hypothetical protein [Salmonella enterica]EEC5249634.1 hypothetical protein [Salmonella enterica subsp. enterica serovar Poona]
MSDFFLAMTREQWLKLKSCPHDFPTVEGYFSTQPEIGDILSIHYPTRHRPSWDHRVDAAKELVIAWVEPIASIPNRYRLKVTFSMTPEDVKQRYGCPFTPLSDMLRKRREEKERARLEKARQLLACRVELAEKYLKKER